jgi:hypothetical protein
MTLLTAVLYEDKQLAELKAIDSDGRVRRVEVRWKSKDPSAITANWLDNVANEIEFQRTADRERLTGTAPVDAGFRAAMRPERKK